MLQNINKKSLHDASISWMWLEDYVLPFMLDIDCACVLTRTLVMIFFFHSNCAYACILLISFHSSNRW